MLFGAICCYLLLFTVLICCYLVLFVAISKQIRLPEMVTKWSIMCALAFQNICIHIHLCISCTFLLSCCDQDIARIARALVRGEATKKKKHIHLCIYTYHIHTPYMSTGLLQRAQAARPPPGLGPGPDRAWDRGPRAALGSWAHVRCMYVVCIYA